MSSPFPILILGAGELGIPVLEALTTHPSLSLPASPPSTTNPISVLIRDPGTTPSASKAATLATLHRLHATPLFADLASLSVPALASLLAAGGFRTIISCAGFALGRGSQLKIAQAVLQARKQGAAVRRFLPWQFGVDYDLIGRGSAQDLFDEQLDVRDLLRAQQEVEWVIVSTGMFTSFLFEEYFGVVETSAAKGDGASAGAVVVRALGSWENAVTVTTPRDIGRVVAEVVADAGIRDEVVFTAGETVTYGRLADIVEGLVGERGKVEREVWTVERLTKELELDPEDAVKKYRAVFAKGRGVSWDEESTFDKGRGMGLMDVEGWAKNGWDFLKR